MTECRSDFAPIRCPCCGAKLDVEDPDDLDTGKPMFREDDVCMTCPVCEHEMIVRVRWLPIYESAEMWGDQS